MPRPKPRSSDRLEEMKLLLDPRVARELAVVVPGFDRAALIGALVGCWGSVDNFAKDIYLEYQAAPRGSMIRQRLLNMVCAQVSAESNADPVRPVDELDEDEIEASIRAYTVRLNVGVAKAPGEPADAEGQDPAV
jgi:hypothetical protein